MESEIATARDTVSRTAGWNGGQEKLKDEETQVEVKQPELLEGTTEEISSADAAKILDPDAEDSPYPEVRAVASPTDDPTLPVNTLRAWLLGIIFTMLGSGCNQFFSMRYPGVTITSLVAQLIAYPFGCALAKILPVATLNLGPLGRYNINPDRSFNVKEHTLVTIMANISFTSAWATDVIQAQVAFYNRPAPAGLQILMVLTCQMFGLGIAGLAADVLVKPASMIWPNTLANAALFQTLHSRENKVADSWIISRFKFFLYVFLGSFFWYFFPGFIFTALSYFTFICWAAPNNVVVNQLFGQIQGLGYFPLTFDWSQVAYNLSPILTPLWAQCNVFAGWLVMFGILPPILYYTNKFYTAYLPMSSSTVYDNTGAEYNGSRIINARGDFVQSAYEDYSPPLLSVTYTICYACSFAVLTCGPIQVFLNYGSEIWDAVRGKGKIDVHTRIMGQNYNPVPKWWYIAITVVVYAMTIAAMEHYAVGWPVWGITIALLMVIVFILPIGVIFAVTNTNTNNMTTFGQIISGYLLPGKPIVALAFKFYAYTGISQAMAFSQDMKLAYYMKLPKRTTFAAQATACVLGAFTQVGVMIWMLGNVKDICTADQADGFSCPQGRTNFAASVIWGAVGPKRLFAIGKIYSGFLHMFWIGALCPIVTWLALKKWPQNRLLRNLNWVVFFGGTGNYPPATGINYTSWFAVGWFFNSYIKRRYGAWWTKYVYVMSSALDVGLALSGIVIFFALSYPGVTLDWWGNSVYENTADGKNTPWKPMPQKGYFGPDEWH